MPAQRLPMRQVREVLRLKHAVGFSERRIAALLEISRTTVAEYLRRARWWASPCHCLTNWTTRHWSGGCSVRPLACPLCQSSCRMDRIGTFGGADSRQWLDTDRRTRTG
jgi:hypothetical protein